MPMPVVKNEGCVGALRLYKQFNSEHDTTRMAHNRYYVIGWHTADACLQRRAERMSLL